jgi:acetyl-CoA carboxylase carboxyltransferase component
MAQSREELEKKLSGMEQKVIAGDPKTVAKLHDQGNLTARERVDRLLDPGTFVEEFFLAETQSTDFGMAERRQPSDGVVTGFGKIDGRPVYVYSQDRSVLAGSVGSAHAEKIAYVIQTARKLGVPVIGLNDSAGARIQEGPHRHLRPSAKYFLKTASPRVASRRSRRSWAPASASVPTRRRSPTFILQVQNTSQMFITGPAVIKEVLGETVTMEELGGARFTPKFPASPIWSPRTTTSVWLRFASSWASCQRTSSNFRRAKKLKTIRHARSRHWRKSFPKTPSAPITLSK